MNQEYLNILKHRAEVQPAKHLMEIKECKDKIL